MATQKAKNTEEQVVQWLKSKGYENIRAVSVEDYDDPASLVRQRDNESFTPRFTARKDNRKYYFELAAKKVKAAKDRLISKWTLLSEIAEIRDSEFHVFAPYGTFSFTNRVLKNHDIEASVVKI